MREKLAIGASALIPSLTVHVRFDVSAAVGALLVAAIGVLAFRRRR
jgi:hypothetical protein